MKTLKLVPFFLVAFLFFSQSAIAQEEEEQIEEIIEDENEYELQTITGTFISFVKGVYTFSYQEDGEDIEIEFSKITPDAKKMVNLDRKDLIGKKFEVTYLVINEEDDYDDEEMLMSVRTITALKEL